MRCVLSQLLDSKVDVFLANPAALLQVLSPTILKLHSTSRSNANIFATLLDSALRVLVIIEAKISVPDSIQMEGSVLPPYTSVYLHDTEARDRSLLSIWGRTVELLWQA